MLLHSNLIDRDSLSVIANPIYHERTKHIKMDYHFMREKVKQGTIQTSYVPSKEQLVNVLDRAGLHVHQYGMVLRKMGVLTPFYSHLERECKGNMKYV